MAAQSAQLVPHQKKENIIGKSLEKLKETSTVRECKSLLYLEYMCARHLSETISL